MATRRVAGPPGGRWKNALATLTEGRRLKFMFLPDGEDPDTLVRKLGAQDFVARLDNATPAIEYLFGELAGGFDLNAIDDRAKLASLAMPYIDRVPAGALKHLMLARVRELTGFKADQTSPSAATGVRQGPKPGAAAQIPGACRRIARDAVETPGIAPGPERRAGAGPGRQPGSEPISRRG